MNPVVDQAARDEIRDALDLTLFVEAGAGTGKTAALVSRVVALVAAGTPLRSIAAITFTEAAASELRDRIRLELERAAMGLTDPPMPGPARANCDAALHELDDAALSTLHGFAHQLLVEHPLAAGLPPRFEVVDDIEAGITFDQRWGDFVDALVVDVEMEQVLLTAFALGLRLDDLRQVARALHDHHDRLGDSLTAPAGLPALALEPAVAPLREALARAGECTSDDDKLSMHLETLVYALGQLDQAEDDLDRLDLLADFPKIDRGQIGARGNWGCDVEEVRALLGTAQAALDRELTRFRLAAVGALVARVRDFVLAFADERRRDGRLEFHDLLVLGRDLLRLRPDVRATLAQRYAAVLVDEFQDTDPLQIEIAVLLATTDPDAGTKPWPEIVLDPGRVFLVGDPKQSIYRFRRADLALYHRVEAELHDGLRHLVQNFRSVPGIVGFVNHVFERLFEGGTPGRQATHVPLEAYRDLVPGAGPAVQVFGEPVTGAKIGPVREREAAEIAALIRRVKAEGWPVLDPVDGTARAARYGDIALLIPTRTALPELERALEAADVPVRIESQSLVYATAEVRDLLAILTALDDPTDEIALVAALRAPAFGCSDTELVEYRLAGGHWDYRREPDLPLADDDRVVAGIAALRDLHHARWWQSVSETVEAVVRERRMLELAVAHRRPRDHWRRIRFLLDQARAYDERGGTGLRGFVEWVRQQADERARAVEVVVPEPDDDAVRVLTVHGAKGLEFAVVVLAGLNAVPQTRNHPVLWTDDGRFEVGVGVKNRGTWVETPGYDELKKLETTLDEEERLRLLYVATTRARDYLLISLHHKEADKKCHAARLSPHIPGSPATVVEIEPPPVSSEPAAAAADDTADELVARAEWIAERAARLTAAARPASVAATALAAEVAGANLDETEEPDPGLRKEADPEDDRPPWQRGRAGTAIGRAVHATLQSVDLAGADDLAPTATAQAWAEEIPGRAAEVRDLVRSVLGAPIVRTAVEGGRFWREVPVAVNIDGVTVEGFVDLLVETPEGLVVVDYKTDRVPGATLDRDGELDSLMAKYRVQGAAYALALERVLGRPVARCVFVFARRGGAAVEREVSDLPAVVAEVEARVRAMS